TLTGVSWMYVEDVGKAAALNRVSHHPRGALPSLCSIILLVFAVNSRFSISTPSRNGTLERNSVLLLVLFCIFCRTLSPGYILSRRLIAPTRCLHHKTRTDYKHRLLSPVHWRPCSRLRG